ncbi:MAG: hypothetical protein KGH95_07500, partial [Thaumarchaeota archaeon]|nr:hypothetical protein [Nitrososphaerota archaeon]
MLKRINLIIAIVVIISLSVILGVYTISNSISDTSNHITLTNITTNPKILHVGDHFIVNVTVNNVGSHDVGFFTDYISGIFDRDVLIS